MPDSTPTLVPHRGAELLGRSVFVIEVDGLRRRATDGASAGETAVLDHVTRRLVASAPPLSTVSLLDDGRLLLVCEGLDKLDAVALADQLVAQARITSVFGLRFPLSIGVAAMPDDGTAEDDVLAAACVAASRATMHGGDMVLGFHRGMERPDSARPTAFVTSLLARSTLPVDFEPIVCTADGSNLGHAATCSVSTDVARGFASVLEDAVRAGRLFELGQRVRLSTELAYRAIDDGRGLLVVEIHPAELLRAGLLVGEAALRGMLDRVVLQLLPGTEATGVDLVVQVAEALRRHGVRFAVDELDARADGVTLLAALRPEFVVLGRSFVANAAHSARGADAVASFAAMAERLGSEVIARAPTTPAWRARLAELGIKYVRHANLPEASEVQA